jgi:quinol monooxygenase YgiN
MFMDLFGPHCLSGLPFAVLSRHERGLAVTVLLARTETGSSDRRELVQAMLNWASLARLASGAVEVRLCEDLEEPGIYCLSSKWESASALEAHLAGPDFGVLLGALEVLGRQTRFDVASRDADAEDGPSLIRRSRARHNGSPLLGRPGGDAVRA